MYMDASFPPPSAPQLDILVVGKSNCTGLRACYAVLVPRLTEFVTKGGARGRQLATLLLALFFWYTNLIVRIVARKRRVIKLARLQFFAKYALRIA